MKRWSINPKIYETQNKMATYYNQMTPEQKAQFQKEISQQEAEKLADIKYMVYFNHITRQEFYKIYLPDLILIDGEDGEKVVTE